MGYWSEKMIEQELGIFTRKVRCKSCGRSYVQSTRDQIPGCRDMEYDECPYCSYVNGSSMQVEYFNQRI